MEDNSERVLEAAEQTHPRVLVVGAGPVGLEAAVQLGVVGKGGAGLRSFVIAAARSAAQQQAPFVVAAHAAVHQAAAAGGGAAALDEWAALDAQLPQLAFSAVLSEDEPSELCVATRASERGRPPNVDVSP